MAYQHIQNHPAYERITALFAKGLNATVIAWHLNNGSPRFEPPYRAKEWNATLVNNVVSSHRQEVK